MKLTLDWPRDTEGYRIETVPAGSGVHILPALIGSVGSAIPKGDEPNDLIVPKSGKLSVRPVVVPALYEKLAACKANARDALYFSNEYGPLDFFHGMGVTHFCKRVRFVRRLIAEAKHGKWEKIAERLEDPNDEKRRSSLIGFSGVIGYDDVGRPQLEFRPRSLIEFIYAQLIQDYTRGAKYKLCIRPGCGEYFYYGSGTGKRNTAMYCSAKCQKAHQYMKLKEETK